jgi:hypothetical protein
LEQFKSGAEATAVQTLRDQQASSDCAKRLDCGGSPPLSRTVAFKYHHLTFDLSLVTSTPTKIFN